LPEQVQIETVCGESKTIVPVKWRPTEMDILPFPGETNQ
jgi:hypothetical protein